MKQLCAILGKSATNYQNCCAFPQPDLAAACDFYVQWVSRYRARLRFPVILPLRVLCLSGVVENVSAPHVAVFGSGFVGVT